MPEIKRILQTRRERRLTRLRRKEAGRRWAVLSTGMVLSLCLAGLILASALAYAGLTRELPPIEGLPGMLNPVDGWLLKPTQIYDRSGQHVLASFGVEDSPRSYIPLDESNETFISPEMARVVVSALDPSFWQHSGYSLSDWRDPARHPTIAQRLVSDLLLYGEKPSMRRALRERILAAQVTARFGRSQVLEWYLNSAD